MSGRVPVVTGANRGIGRGVATDMGGPGGRSVHDGAASIMWAIDLPEAGPTGGFYRDGRPLPW